MPDHGARKGLRVNHWTCAAAAGVALAAAALASCAGRAAPPAPRIHLNTERQPAAIEVVGVPADVVAAVSDARFSDDDWRALLRVSVRQADPGAMAGDVPAVAGEYAIEGSVIRFTPMFPLDPGRQYDVLFDQTRLPGADRRSSPMAAVVGTPAIVRTPTTTVTHVYPSAHVVPANQLRLYIHFSAPMGQRGGFERIRLLDERGAEVVDPFLPIDSDYWSEDRTRYTVFFDPGRVKRGILPNRQMGRALEEGRRYTLVVAADWRDGQGQPLRSEFRHEFSVRPADERPLTTESWRVSSPAAATREALAVTFPSPLDHGLLQRALGVSRGGTTVSGEVRIEAQETRWLFVPRDPWQPGEYELVALSILEDLAGNRIGRAFEVDEFDRTDRSAEPERFLVPFRVRSTTTP
jgi:hypothetical protein